MNLASLSEIKEQEHTRKETDRPPTVIQYSRRKTSGIARAQWRKWRPP